MARRARIVPEATGSPESPVLTVENDPIESMVNLSILRTRIVDLMKSGQSEIRVRDLLYLIRNILRENQSDDS